jgi:hypothetical protein
MLRRPIYEYDAAHGPAIYRSKVWKKPVGPPLKMTFAQADALPNVVELQGSQLFAKPGTAIQATVLGKPYGGARVLERADLIVLYLVRDAYPDRPFYISKTTGSYDQEMGLAPYMVSVGLVKKLLPTPPTAAAGYVQIPGEGWEDLQTTRILWETDFLAPNSLPKHSPWVDRPSAGIPYLYVRTGAALTGALSERGLTAEANRIMSQTQRIAKATGFEDLLASR